MWARRLRCISRSTPARDCRLESSRDNNRHRRINPSPEAFLASLAAPRDTLEWRHRSSALRQRADWQEMRSSAYAKACRYDRRSPERRLYRRRRPPVTILSLKDLVRRTMACPEIVWLPRRLLAASPAEEPGAATG